MAIQLKFKFGSPAVDPSTSTDGALYLDASNDRIWARGHRFDFFTDADELFWDDMDVANALRFKATTSAQTNLSIQSTYSPTPSFQYSYDGIHWEDYVLGTTLAVNNTGYADDVLFIKGNNPNGISGWSENPDSFTNTTRFVINQPCQCQGSVMNLLGDGISEIPSGTTFAWLFYNTPIVSAPTLPATSLQQYCYSSMFRGCTGLTSAPALPATILQQYCYRNMFQGCTGLTSAPTLPAMTLQTYCYFGMFSGCSGLTSAPALPARTLASQCYYGMFQDCTGLTSAPTLPATTLAEYCYANMFQGCTGLTSAPTLPATTLVRDCYSFMFYGCTGLTSAPTLPATTLVRDCYSFMFYGCTNLNYVKALFTTTPSASYTAYWLSNVASTGLFIRNDNATWHNSITLSGTTVPQGWMIWGENEIPQCLCFTAKTAGSTIKLIKGAHCSVSPTFVKSTDGGITWSDVTVGTTSTAETITLSSVGDKVYIKAKTTNSALASSSIATSSHRFSMTGSIDASGKVSSLLGENVTSLSTNYTFAHLFYNCTGLTTAPDLSDITSLSDSCYYQMFRDCTGLTSAPALPATTLANNCYYYMFYGCTGLTSAPALPAMTLANNCYCGMFNGCTGLTSAPTLPATTLADTCYDSMFQGCTGLTSALALPATTLATFCYYQMFYGCSGLTSAPALPATTLATYCYYGMFRDCTGLTSAPSLPATTLERNCYSYMFFGCSNLNYIKAMFLDVPSTDYTNNWVKNVASTGTFVKNPAATWQAADYRGVYGVPTNWVVEGEVQDVDEPECLCFTAKTAGSTIQLLKGASCSVSPTFVKSTDGGRTWSDLTVGTTSTAETITLSSVGDKVYIKAKTTNSTLASVNLAPYSHTFNMTGSIDASGKVSSLLGENVTSLSTNNAFANLFNGCTALKTAPDLSDITTLTTRCYYQMFQGCTGLTSAPALPATTLATYCYYGMFYDCTGLTSAPALPATTLANGCYFYMFSGCTGLTSAPALPATTLANNCYYYMFSGCTGLTSAPTLPATTLADSCYCGMFYGCTGLTSAPTLPATTLADTCYDSMFQGCSNLNYIKAMFLDAPSTDYTTNWVYGVSSSGTFVKNPEATWKAADYRGVNGVPTNWVVEGEVEEPDCLCFTAKTAGSTVKLVKGSSCTVSPTFVKSTDGGRTWSDVTVGTTSSAETITLSAVGDKVYIKAKTTNSTLASSSIATSYAHTFNMTGSIDASGKLSTLLGENVTSLSDYYTFANLFNGCTALKTAPDLSDITTLTEYCYESMFQGCTGLTSAPALPATTLANYCYDAMFQGCTGLTSAPALPAMSLQQYCYSSMFNGCTGLTSAPALPATTLANSCYSEMFQGCTGLTSALALPATTLATYCYSNMFYGCSGLTSAPALPATTLVTYCYYGMFRNCTGLTSAPTLPATTLVSNCYSFMFFGCSNLNYIKAMFLNAPTTTYTTNWVNNVSSSGTFVKNPEATWKAADYRGVYGVPTNWVVEGEIEEPDCLCFTAKTAGSTVKLVKGDSCSVSPTFVKSTDGGRTWSDLTVGTSSTAETITLSSVGDKVYIKAKTTNSALASNASSSYTHTFNMTGSIDASGKISSLLGENVTTLSTNYAFANLFRSCTALKTAPDLSDIATLAAYCYYAMFYGCTGLTSAPALPATSVRSSCYYQMFRGCENLTTAPALPATSLSSATYCYYQMFYGCTGLTSAPALPATTLANNCYYGMFQGCTGLTSAPATLPATTLATYCYFGMFRNCTGLTSAPTLPATTLVSSCYSYMFYGCSKLNYVKALFTTTPSTSYTNQWMSSVATTGTFVRNDDATWQDTITLGASTVPTGWMIRPENEVQEPEIEEPDCLCFTAKTAGSTVKLVKGNSCLVSPTFVKSTDGGRTWSDLTVGTTSTAETITLSAVSDKVYIKAKTTNSALASGSLPSNAHTFNMTGSIDASGKVSSLLGENVASLSTNYTFDSLFDGCTALKTAPDLSDITTLTEYCYDFMFRNCTGLTSAPALPATTLASNCYSQMFYGCSGLTSAPTLPATTLAEYCYSEMFRNCTGLTSAPALPSTTLTDACYSYMFFGCTGLTSAPALPARTLANYCYFEMFEGCTGLTSAPALPATTLASFCYSYMFSGCTGLTSAPALPATTLEHRCYEYMFYGCTGLTSAPALPATTFTNGCYTQMFYGCSNLNYIEAMFLEAPSTIYTYQWLSSVAATGTFVKNPEATWKAADYRGVDGVPTNWVVEGEVEEPDCLCFTAKTAGSTIKLVKGSSCTVSPTFVKSTDGGRTWSDLTVGTTSTAETITLSSVGDKVYIKAKTTNSALTSSGLATSYSHTFNMTGSIDASGKLSTLLGENVTSLSTNFAFANLFRSCTALKTAPDLSDITSLSNYCYSYMFYGCTGLTSAPTLPATSLASGCYTQMFRGCTGLTSAPALPATTLAEYCYSYMFYGCTDLTSAPALPATTLQTYCYGEMFNGCTGLTSAPALPATTLANSCYEYMFYGCTGLTSAPALPATMLMIACYDAMFSGCTGLTSAPALPATTLANQCYDSMFQGCSNLNYIKAMFLVAPSTTYTANWVDGVSYSGTFVKNPEATWKAADYRGVNGVPTNWLVEGESIIEVDLNMNEWSEVGPWVDENNTLYTQYQSESNHNVNSGIATMYLEFTGTSISFIVRSDAESTYDFVQVYNPDDNSTIAYTTSGKQLQYITCSFTGLSNTVHRIKICYKKDSSVNSGADRGYVYVPI